ncbi:hypothetical protein V1477_009295 [Vespula maculifrons]|uniref:Uncharacterized protein n=1 Tax=Vespula maculifrons TaxID=7453 RepID=A0ABD2C9D3_VESMC
MSLAKIRKGLSLPEDDGATFSDPVRSLFHEGFTMVPTFNGRWKSRIGVAGFIDECRAGYEDPCRSFLSRREQHCNKVSRALRLHRLEHWISGNVSGYYSDGSNNEVPFPVKFIVSRRTLRLVTSPSIGVAHRHVTSPCYHRSLFHLYMEQTVLPSRGYLRKIERLADAQVPSIGDIS